MSLTIHLISLKNLILILFGLFPILPNKFKGLPVILLILYSFIQFLKNKEGYVKRIKPFLIMSSLYLFYILTFIYSNNTIYFGKKLETGLSLLIIPLSFLFHNEFINKKSADFFKKIYLFGVTVFTVILYLFLFIYQNDRYPNGIKDVNFIRSASENLPLIETHPIYSSIFLAIGILILISSFKQIRLFVFVPLLILLTTGVILLSSKMVIISLFVILVLFIGSVIINIKQRLLLIFVALIIPVFAIIYIPNINSRFNELFTNSTYSEINKNNSSSIRVTINSCTFELIEKSWFFGYGVGDVQDELNTCYRSRSTLLLENQYNTHNQYLSIWLGTGLIGLLAFLYMLFFNFRLAKYNNDLLFISLLILFSLNLLTENILERQSGVIIFSFLINFYGIYNLKKLDQSM